MSLHETRATLPRSLLAQPRRPRTTSKSVLTLHYTPLYYYLSQHYYNQPEVSSHLLCAPLIMFPSALLSFSLCVPLFFSTFSPPVLTITIILVHLHVRRENFSGQFKKIKPASHFLIVPQRPPRHCAHYKNTSRRIRIFKLPISFKIPDFTF